MSSTLCATIASLVRSYGFNVVEVTKTETMCKIRFQNARLHRGPLTLAVPSKTYNYAILYGWLPQRNVDLSFCSSKDKDYCVAIKYHKLGLTYIHIHLRGEWKEKLKKALEELSTPS